MFDESVVSFCREQCDSRDDHDDDSDGEADRAGGEPCRRPHVRSPLQRRGSPAAAAAAEERGRGAHAHLPVGECDGQLPEAELGRETALPFSQVRLASTQRSVPRRGDREEVSGVGRGRRAPEQPHQKDHREEHPQEEFGQVTALNFQLCITPISVL